MNDFVVVIPARYASERLPGKPLRIIAGKPLLQHGYERAVASNPSEVIIATDDERIAAVAKRFGAEVCMTSKDHQSGTERLAEVARTRRWPDDRIVVNLQGDEPLMPPALITQCARLLESSAVDVGTLASPLQSRADFENPNVVKVVVDYHGNAIYFSRAAIPWSRSSQTDQLAVNSALHHHGIYAWRKRVLQQIVEAPPSPLELCERLEQLRAVQLGLKIAVAVPAVRPGPGVDTEEDLERVAQLLERT